MSDTALPTGTPEHWEVDDETQPHQAKHRRDNVPLDGAPDLGLFGDAHHEPDAIATEFGENPDTEVAG